MASTRRKIARILGRGHNEVPKPCNYPPPSLSVARDQEVGAFAFFLREIMPELVHATISDKQSDSLADNLAARVHRYWANHRSEHLQTTAFEAGDVVQSRQIVGSPLESASDLASLVLSAAWSSDEDVSEREFDYAVDFCLLICRKTSHCRLKVVTRLLPEETPKFPSSLNRLWKLHEVGILAAPVSFGYCLRHSVTDKRLGDALESLLLQHPRTPVAVPPNQSVATSRCALPMIKLVAVWASTKSKHSDPSIRNACLHTIHRWREAHLKGHTTTTGSLYRRLWETCPLIDDPQLRESIMSFLKEEMCEYFIHSSEDSARLELEALAAETLTGQCGVSIFRLFNQALSVGDVARILGNLIVCRKGRWRLLTRLCISLNNEGGKDLFEAISYDVMQRLSSEAHPDRLSFMAWLTILRHTLCRKDMSTDDTKYLQPYLSWLQENVTSEKVPKQCLKALLHAMTLTVPYEPLAVLQVHRHFASKLGRTQTFVCDYYDLVSTRLNEMGVALQDTVTDVPEGVSSNELAAESLTQFAENGKIPEKLLRVYYFYKSWWTSYFVPELMKVSQVAKDYSLLNALVERGIVGRDFLQDKEGKSTAHSNTLLSKLKTMLDNLGDPCSSTLDKGACGRTIDDLRSSVDSFTSLDWLPTEAKGVLASLLCRLVWQLTRTVLMASQCSNQEILSENIASAYGHLSSQILSLASIWDFLLVHWRGILGGERIPTADDAQTLNCCIVLAAKAMNANDSGGNERLLQTVLSYLRSTTSTSQSLRVKYEVGVWFLNAMICLGIVDDHQFERDRLFDSDRLSRLMVLVVKPSSSEPSLSDLLDLFVAHICCLHQFVHGPNFHDRNNPLVNQINQPISLVPFQLYGLHQLRLCDQLGADHWDWINFLEGCKFYSTVSCDISLVLVWCTDILHTACSPILPTMSELPLSSPLQQLLFALKRWIRDDLRLRSSSVTDAVGNGDQFRSRPYSWMSCWWHAVEALVDPTHSGDARTTIFISRAVLPYFPWPPVASRLVSMIGSSIEELEDYPSAVAMLALDHKCFSQALQFKDMKYQQLTNNFRRLRDALDALIDNPTDQPTLSHSAAPPPVVGAFVAAYAFRSVLHSLTTERAEKCSLVAPPLSIDRIFDTSSWGGSSDAEECCLKHLLDSVELLHQWQDETIPHYVYPVARKYLMTAITSIFLRRSDLVGILNETSPLADVAQRPPTKKRKHGSDGDATASLRYHRTVEREVIPSESLRQHLRTQSPDEWHLLTERCR